ncbi:helix-turn-helix transcriptional regulator [Streptomyces sp. APSN-46.1]|uniref:helix-turn-helix domain-containing protein n=1 Tax=Streptomyces sp. APSN-46.1 TaxID=2929049 RepID=UPI001FB2C15F|nr:helix-turn-helix transcriptional regulator [Streptomyces sp. APSN-46.1]MCJ1678569.1 helix-turn-helix transcriptional regulator [Streptomyces sp. APSN-46.1]
MAPRKDIDGSASVPAFYGKELRWRREHAGRTLQQVVEGSYYGVSYLSEIERGNRRIPLDLAQHVDRVLDTDGFFARRCEDVRKARSSVVASYFTEALELESRAQGIEEWTPMVIPGPLQLEPYIRELVHAAHPLADEERVAQAVARRRERAWVYEDADGPASWVVLHESLLRQPVGGDEAMAEQLAHVAAVARRRRYIPQILPCNAGVHPFMTGSTHFMSFSDAPPVVYMESMYSGQLIDDPGVVVQYQNAYNRLRAAALPPEVSLKMIEAAAEDYGSGNHARRLEHGRLATAPPPWGSERKSRTA